MLRCFRNGWAKQSSASGPAVQGCLGRLNKTLDQPASLMPEQFPRRWRHPPRRVGPCGPLRQRCRASARRPGWCAGWFFGPGGPGPVERCPCSSGLAGHVTIEQPGHASVAGTGVQRGGVAQPKALMAINPNCRQKSGGSSREIAARASRRQWRIPRASRRGLQKRQRA